jgi:catechol 2,3-dioxygenase-like lactoylglutathione lyase family enzyme
MLASNPVIATIAVKDVDAARRFYEGTLGLSRVDLPSPDPTTDLYRSGSSAILVYQSAYAGTNQATCVCWPVGDEIDAIVDDLTSKGVGFERYEDIPGATLEGDVHVMGSHRTAWFKDPDGNILNLTNDEAGL